MDFVGNGVFECTMRVYMAHGLLFLLFAFRRREMRYLAKSRGEINKINKHVKLFTNSSAGSFNLRVSGCSGG